MASPCPKRWAELTGDDTRRFCASCNLHVTNLSALERGAAEAFLATSTGRVCVSYVPGEGGGVATRVPRRRGFARLVASAASFLAGLVFLLPGCRPAPDRDGAEDPDGVEPADGEHTRVLGKVRADPECRVDGDRMIMGEMVVPEELRLEPAE